MDTIKELLNLDITTDMVIHMFIKTETIIMVHMDMKLNMITKNDLLKLSQATAMVAIAISMSTGLILTTRLRFTILKLTIMDMARGLLP